MTGKSRTRGIGSKKKNSSRPMNMNSNKSKWSSEDRYPYFNNKSTELGNFKL